MGFFSERDFAAARAVARGASIRTFSLATRLRAGRPMGAAAMSAMSAEERAAAAAILSASERVDGAFADSPEKRFFLAPDRVGLVMYGETGRARVALGAPFGPETARGPAAAAFLAASRAARRRAVFYKTRPEDAATLESIGLRVEKIGEEAEIPLEGFSLDGSSHRELRRKLRGAAKEGLEIQHCRAGAAPVAACAVVSAGWIAARKGPEMGFSMGRFSLAHIAAAETICAWRGERLMAFATLVRSGDGTVWGVDLTRSDPEAPAGAMHAIVVAAIEAAQAGGARWLSLGAATFAGLDDADAAGFAPRMGALLYERAGRMHHLEGLRRFKNAFRPDWTPICIGYLNRRGLARDIIAIRRLVAARPRAERLPAGE